MNNEQNKNVASRGPLIFTVPASHFPFLVALNIGWLDVTERTAEEKRRTHNLTVATQRLDSATSEVHDSRYDYHGELKRAAITPSAGCQRERNRAKGRLSLSDNRLMLSCLCTTILRAIRRLAKLISG